jgi:hypothetical protein
VDHNSGAFKGLDARASGINWFIGIASVVKASPAGEAYQHSLGVSAETEQRAPSTGWQNPLMEGLLMSIAPVIACAVVVIALASAQGVSAQNRPVELTRAGPGC